MRKLKIKITPETDIHKAVDNLRDNCTNAGISHAEQRSLIEKVESVAIDLATRGRELSSIGSQFRVKRIIESETCQVVIDIDFGGQRPTFIGKLRSLFSKG